MAKTWEETVMIEEQIVEAIKEARKDTVKTYARYRAVSRKQAEHTWSIAEKTGIQKAVDWARMFYEGKCLFLSEEGELQLREWGVK